MSEHPFMQWLQDENLLALAKKYAPNFERVFTQCLKVGKERVLLVGDYGYPTRRVAPLLTGCYFLAAQKLGISPLVALQDPRQGMDEAEQEVIESLFELPDNSTIIVNVSGKIGSMQHVGKSFRKFVRIHGHRFISTPTLGNLDTYMIKSLIAALDIDYTAMHADDLDLKRKIAAGRLMHLTGRAGTKLTIDLANVDVRSADGSYHKFGTGGNLPAGDVYFAPANTNGMLVVDASVRTTEGAVLVKTPVYITIENNRITKIEGGEEAKLLEKSLKLAESKARFPSRVRHCAEIGIGTNPHAKIIGSTIIDEKAYGTAHVAIGSNYWFGGTNRTIIHYDQVFNHARIKIDGRSVKF